MSNHTYVFAGKTLGLLGSSFTFGFRVDGRFDHSGFGAGYFNIDFTTIQFLLVEILGSLESVFQSGKSDEAIASRASSVVGADGNDLGFKTIVAEEVSWLSKDTPFTYTFPEVSKNSTRPSSFVWNDRLPTKTY